MLPLADRKLTPGRKASGPVPIGLLAVALLLVGLRWVDVEVAFFGAAALTVPTRQINAREACAAIEWPVIVMLACLIPVGEGLKDTGATSLIANALTQAASQVPAFSS